MRLTEKQKEQITGYYFFLSGRMYGKRSDYYLSKAFECLTGDFSGVTEEDLENCKKYRGNYDKSR